MIDFSFSQLIKPSSEYRLSGQTADLIRRYAETDADGCIVNFQIINDEIVQALEEAGGGLFYDAVFGEEMSKYWFVESPCDTCAAQEDCGITCRKRHIFDKEIYGGLLCGKLPCCYIVDLSSLPEVVSEFEINALSCRIEDLLDGVTQKFDEADRTPVYFKVHLTDRNTLVWERSIPQPLEKIYQVDEHTVAIGRRRITLRPWSLALYMLFVRHPEGLPLNAVFTDCRKEFVRIYHEITRSDLKVAKLNAMFDKADDLQRTINDKLSELNIQLAGQGIRENLRVMPENYKSNNKPYFIRHLNRHLKKA